MRFDVIHYFGRRYPTPKIHEIRFIQVSDEKSRVSLSEIDSELHSMYS